MPEFSEKSKNELATCCPLIQKVFNKVIVDLDCTIIQGRRSKELQNQYFKEGKSKLQWPNSKHNVLDPTDLSQAVDVAPYIQGKGIIWEPNQCYFFAGWVLKTANILGVPIRWGGDWDMDIDVNDQNFNDLVHFELRTHELCSD